MRQAATPTCEVGVEEVNPVPSSRTFRRELALALSPRTAWDVLRLLRPLDCGIAFLATFIGASLAGVLRGSPSVVVLIAASNLLVLAASMAFNDWHDVEEDAINRPRAPIQAGRVSREGALLLACVLFAAGIVVAHASSWQAAAYVSAFIVGSVAYTLWLKRWPFLGNVLVALLSSYPLWCWMLLTGRVPVTHLMLTLCCVLFCVGREILGTARDHEGDASCGIRTVATSLGARSADRLGALIVVSAALPASWPLLAGEATLVYVILLVASLVLGLWLAGRAFGSALAGGTTSASLVRVARVITALMAVAFSFGLASPVA